MTNNASYNENEYSNHVMKIVAQINDTKYDRIVAIPRGGLILGVHLSHILKTPLEVYSGKEIWVREKNTKYLWVDDIADSGVTLGDIKLRWYGSEMYDDSFDCAVLIWNIDNPSVRPKYYGKIIDRRYNTSWYDFWWEKKPKEKRYI